MYIYIYIYIKGFGLYIYIYIYIYMHAYMDHIWAFAKASGPESGFGEVTILGKPYYLLYIPIMVT